MVCMETHPLSYTEPYVVAPPALFIVYWAPFRPDSEPYELICVVPYVQNMRTSKLSELDHILPFGYPSGFPNAPAEPFMFAVAEN